MLGLDGFQTLGKIFLGWQRADSWARRRSSRFFFPLRLGVGAMRL